MLSIVIPCHNAGRRAIETALRYQDIARQADCPPIEILIVDDASAEPERNLLVFDQESPVRIIDTPINLGRGGAVNFGARAARGDRLLIVDCDCPPAGTSFLHDHLRALELGADASVGRLQRRRDDFWGFYQDRAVRRRERQFENGMPYAFTSQNLMIAASWFRRIGGFDEAYKHYGFEDRDFFIRLAEAGARIAYTPSAAVIHDDVNIFLTTVVPKMRKAGAITSAYFSKQHPSEYARLGYAAIDVSVRPWLRPLAMTVGKIAFSAAPLIDWWLPRRPFALARILASAASGFSFMVGTCERVGEKH
jgi:glycosyltransferase involved in cell wall biosynthesis